MKKLIVSMLLVGSILLPSMVRADSYSVSTYQWGGNVYVNASINTQGKSLRDVLLTYEVCNGSCYYNSQTVAIKNFGSWANIFNMKHGKARIRIIDYKYNITNYSNWVSF